MIATSVPVRRYTRIAMLLHWLVALLIAVNVALIWSVDVLPDAWVRPVIDTHKSIGITVLGLVLMRLLWRAAHTPPPLPEDYARWEKTAAHAAHVALYALILGLPLSGWMHDSAWKAAGEIPMYLFGVVQWPRIGWIMQIDPVLKEKLHDVFGAIHGWLGYGLYALVALHIGAALKHQWWDKHPGTGTHAAGAPASLTPPRNDSRRRANFGTKPARYYREREPKPPARSSASVV